MDREEQNELATGGLIALPFFVFIAWLGQKLSLFALVTVMLISAGCSIRVEAGYHGKTGIDDRTVTPEFRGVKSKDMY